MLLTLLTLLSIVTSVGQTSDDVVQEFSITTKRDTDNVVVTIEQDTTVFSIHSPFGIGQATIGRTIDQWPKIVILRLHLKGLENFRAMNGEATLNASVSSQEKRLWLDDHEGSPLDSESPFWMEISRVNNDEKRSNEIPLSGGYFEIRLPKTFFKDNPKSITVFWIDFYRG